MGWLYSCVGEKYPQIKNQSWRKKITAKLAVYFDKGHITRIPWIRRRKEEKSNSSFIRKVHIHGWNNKIHYQQLVTETDEKKAKMCSSSYYLLLLLLSLNLHQMVETPKTIGFFFLSPIANFVPKEKKLVSLYYDFYLSVLNL